MPVRSRSTGDTARYAVTVGAVAVLSVVPACSLFKDLGVESHPLSEAGCKLAKPLQRGNPVPPALTDFSFAVGLRRIDFGEAPDAGLSDFTTVGFDLDDRCTTNVRQYTCRKPSWAATTLDGPGGRDNSYHRFFATLDGGALAPQTNDTAASGILTAVLSVSGYNGNVADTQVNVAVYGATTCRITGGASICPGIDGGPSWNGVDVWRPLADWVAPDDGGQHQPLYRSDTAYVTNHWLVAHFPRYLLAFGVHLTDTWVQAKLKEVGSHAWALQQGVLSGRANIDDMLANIEFYVVPGTTNQPICTDWTGYAAAKRAICARADISSTSNDAAAPCDATSWAWTFEAEPVQLSSEVFPAGEATFRTCGKTSPRNDHCGSTLDAGVP